MTQELTGRKALVKSVLWNGVGTIAPLLAAFVSIPILISVLGTARFGVLTLIWLVVGYFSIFDLGLGRALTKLVAERVNTASEHEIPLLANSALVFMTLVGAVGAALLTFGAPWLIGSALNIPVELQSETLAATRLLAISVPIVVVSTGLRGLLEAYQRFDLVAAVRLPVGILTYLAPLGAAMLSADLSVVVIALLLTRLCATIAYVVLCVRRLDGLGVPPLFSRIYANDLLHFGGWMTVSNLVGPVLLYSGRIAVAVILTAEAVAYFSTPYEIVSKLLLIPGVVVGVLFPAFSNLFVTDLERGKRLYRNSNFAIAGLLIVPVSLVVLFADWGLTAWINEDFAHHGARVAQLLAIGVFVNSFGHIAQTVVQGSGRPSWTASLHLCELILYVPYLWWFVTNHGINGAAEAWVIRVTISTVVLVAMARIVFAMESRTRNELGSVG